MMKSSLLFALLVGMCAILACQKKTGELKVITAADISEGKIFLKNAAGELRQGGNDLIVEFRDASGALVPVEKAQMSAAMPMPGMSAMTTSVDLKPAGEKGRFTAQPDFDMRGGWQCSVEYRSPTGQASNASFNINVR